MKYCPKCGAELRKNGCPYCNNMSNQVPQEEKINDNKRTISRVSGMVFSIINLFVFVPISGLIATYLTMYTAFIGSWSWIIWYPLFAGYAIASIIYLIENIIRFVFTKK